jgi:PAS domain S-box-containing protein
MTDEPDIVRQLRDEEKRGLLQGSTETVYEKENISQPLERNSDTTNENIESLIQTMESEQKNNDDNTILHDTEEIFRTIFNNVNDVIVYIDRYGKFLLVNNRVKDIFGYDPSELVGKNVFRCGIFKLTHIPKMIKLFKEIVQREDIVDNTGKKINVTEFEIKRKDGTSALVETSSTVLKKDGKNQGFICILRDITTEKKAEQKLKESEKKHRTLVELAPDGIVIINKLGMITSCNEALSKSFGFSQEELIGKNFMKFPMFKSSGSAQIIKLFSNLITGKGSGKYEFDVPNKDGSYRRIEAHVDLYRENDTVVGIVAVIHDITEQKKIMDSLRISEQRYRTIVENTSDMIMLTRPDGVISYVSPSCKDVVGHEAADLIGKTPWIIYEDDLEFVQQHFSQALQGSNEKVIEYRVRTKRGDIKWVSHSWSPLLEDKKISVIVSVVRDVTERKNTEQLNKKTEEKFRELTQLLPESVFEMTLDGKITFANTTSLKLFGYSQQDIENGLNTFQIIAPEQHDILKMNLALSFSSNEKTKPFEYRVVTKDGRTFPALINTNIIFDEQKNPIGLRGILIDISDRKKEEEVLKKSELRYRELTELLPESVFEMTLDGNFIYVNSAAMNLFRYSQADVADGLNAIQMIVPADHQRMKENLGKILQGISLGTNEYTAVKKNGELFSVLINTNVILDENKKPVGFRGIITDITERKKTEEQIKLSEEKFRALAENSQDIIMRFDRNLRHLYVNSRVTSQLGLKPERMIGKTHAELGFPKDLICKWEDAIQKVFDTGECNRIEFQLPNQTWIDWLLSPEFSPDGTIKAVLASARDITERTKAEVALKNSEQQLTHIINFLPDATFAIDQQGKVIMWNQAMETMTGVHAEEIIGKGNYEYSLPFYKQRRPILIDLINKSDEELKESYTGIQRDGETLIAETYISDFRSKEIYLWGKATPLYDLKGNVIGTIESIRDITQRKIGEKELQESEKRYRLLVDNTEFPVVVTSITDGRILFYNQRAKLFFGVDSDDASKVKAQDFWVHPEERDGFIAALSKDKRVSGYECELKSTTGEKRWVLVSAHIIIYDTQPAAFLIYNDISDRKKMETLLHQSKKEVENILNAAADGIRIVGTDFTIRAMNQTMALLSGISIKDGIGKYCKEMFGSEEVCGTDQCSLHQILTTGKKFQREICRNTADGKKQYYLQLATPYRDNNGTIIGVIEDFRDITEIKNFEVKLKESEKKYRDLTELLPETIFEADLSGRVTYGNQKAFETFGYQPKDLENGLFIRDVIAPESIQAFKENYGRILSGQSSNGNEYIFIKKNGTRFPVLVYSSPVVRGNEIVGVRGAAIEITELKKIQEDLQLAYNKVKTLIEQKDDFINQLGHDLKTPLLPLVNLLPLIRDKEENPKSKERLDVLIQSVQYMRDLVLKTLSLAKLNSPALQFEIKDIDIVDEIGRIIKNNHLLFDEHQIKVENTIAGPLLVKADPLRFEELLQNLLSNAVNYSPNGGTIILHATQQDNWITVSITDSGIGLAKEQLEKIFLEFYKVDEARHSLDSCGLGLTICKRIVEKHGGKIWVESQGTGKGSTFSFTLPRGV